MDIQHLDQHLVFPNQMGVTINLQEKIRFRIAALQLRANVSHQRLLFWGRIEGTAKNYYIIIGLDFQGNYEFPHKKFYWWQPLFISVNTNFIFQQLPPLNPLHKENMQKVKGFFSGDPTKILVNVEGQGEGQGEADPPPQDPDNQKPKQEDELEQKQIKPKPKNLLQIDRLVYVVLAIENDCQLIPIGSYRMTPQHELNINKNYKGFNLQKAMQLSSYMHFRSIQGKQKREDICSLFQLESQEVIFKESFLDLLTEDQPKGCWSLQSDGTNTMVTIRSLKWPGYIGYLKIKSCVYGGVYFGEGLKNISLAFLL